MLRSGDATRDAGRLAGDALAGTVRSIHRTHRAISRRTYDAIGPVAQPVRVVGDGLTAGIYGIVAGAGHVLPRAGAIAATVRSTERSDEAEAWHPRSRRARALGALNGLKGDIVTSDYRALAFPMALRDHVNGNHVNGGDVEVSRSGLASAYPTATSRVAVFVHGLCETDRSWWDGAERLHGDPSVSYGTLLESDLGYTPVYLRYNSGLPVAENGRMLAELLHCVVEAWPVPIDEIALIGHSMGGLVVRSACHRADVDDLSWVRSVGHVVCLGTPHLGAPLERAVDRLVPVLDRMPETRPVAEFLRDRSRGVQDLRHGVFVDGDEHGEVPFVANAKYHFVGATVTHDRNHPVGRAVGDLLVRYSSAAGSDGQRRIPFDVEHGAHVGGVNHFDLLDHPAVYEHLRDWLAVTR